MKCIGHAGARETRPMHFITSSRGVHEAVCIANQPLRAQGARRDGGKEDRLPDGTHFSLLGYEKFAKEWMIYLKN